MKGGKIVHGDAQVGKVARLWAIWRDMRKRCNPLSSHESTERYAKRGIAVCDEWGDYSTFKTWALANGYADDLTLERQDNDGAYSPSNCSWVTKKEQCRNRSTTRWIEINGERKALAAWLEQTGVKNPTYHNRIKRGRPLAQALGLEERK